MSNSLSGYADRSPCFDLNFISFRFTTGSWVGSPDSQSFTPKYVRRYFRDPVVRGVGSWAYWTWNTERRRRRPRHTVPHPLVLAQEFLPVEIRKLPERHGQSKLPTRTYSEVKGRLTKKEGERVKIYLSNLKSLFDVIKLSLDDPLTSTSLHQRWPRKGRLGQCLQQWTIVPRRVIV